MYPQGVAEQKCGRAGGERQKKVLFLGAVHVGTGGISTAYRNSKLGEDSQQLRNEAGSSTNSLMEKSHWWPKLLPQADTCSNALGPSLGLFKLKSCLSIELEIVL